MAQVNMDFPSNSDRSRDAANRPPVEPVVSSSNITSASKSWGQRLVRAFISSDASNIKEYVVCDVIIPTIKDTIVNSVRMLFYGNSVGGSSRSGGGYHYNYSKISQNAYGNRTTYGYGGTGTYDRAMDYDPSLPDYRDIVITGPNARYEAEKIVTEMRNNMERYGSVPVADLYRLVGMTPDYTKENWGWSGDPNQIGIRMANGGWLICVPAAVPI